MYAELGRWAHGADNRGESVIVYMDEMVDALTTLDMNGNGCCRMIIDEDADGDNDYTITNML